MRKIIIVFLCMFVSNAFALAFHYDNVSVELTTTKHTSPALHILNNGVVYYGALFSVNDYTVPPNVVHIMQPDGREYFLGPWCNAGQYPSPETNQCIPCGYGHYCTGGHHRDSCTYGIIACNTTNNTYDPPMPTGTSGMYNRALTMAEVNQYVPQTDISQWEKVYAGNPADIIYLNCNESNLNDARLSVLNHEVEHGTYIVAHEYMSSGHTSAVTGRENDVSSAYIVVFDHAVSYRPTHICRYFYNYFDTLHTTWQEADLQIPTNYMNSNENLTNINNVLHIMNDFWYGLYLYKLN